MDSSLEFKLQLSSQMLMESSLNASLDFDMAYRFCYSSIPDSKDFHSKSIENDNPFLYCLLAVPSDKVNLDIDSF
jgi:hypothetical protein